MTTRGDFREAVYQQFYDTDRSDFSLDVDGIDDPVPIVLPNRTENTNAVPKVLLNVRHTEKQPTSLTGHHFTVRGVVTAEITVRPASNFDGDGTGPTGEELQTADAIADAVVDKLGPGVQLMLNSQVVKAYFSGAYAEEVGAVGKDYAVVVQAPFEYYGTVEEEQAA